MYSALAINELYYVMDEYIPSHLVWHSAYYGLVFNPDWRVRFAEAHSNATGDDVPFKGSGLYLEKAFGLNEAYINDVTAGRGIKWRTHERIMKRAYMDFAVHNPGYMLALDAWHKPRMLYSYYTEVVGKAAYALPPDLLLLVGGLLAAVGIAAGLASGRSMRAHPVLAAAAIGTAASLVPLIFAYPAYHAIGDQIWWITSLFGVLAVMGIAAVAARLAPRVTPKKNLIAPQSA